MKLILTPLQNIPLVEAGDDLSDILLNGMEETGIQVEDGDVLVLAQKIVSKAEGCMVNLTEVTPSTEASKLGAKTEKDARVVELILQESNQILRTRPGLIVVEHKLGFVCANAGIDHSNVKGAAGDHNDWVLLLPENPDHSAQLLRDKIVSETGNQVGVMIIDSHGRAWRLGTVGIAIGIAGIPGLVDLRGEPDIYGRPFEVTEIGAADELAAAASLVMGQAAEKRPIVHGRGFPYAMRESKLSELIRPEKEDLFR